MSSVVAFEIARQLIACGETVEHLFLFDGMNPVVYPKTAFSSPLSLVNATKFHLSEMTRLKPVEILPYVKARVKTMQGYAALRGPEKRTIDRESDEFENIETMVAVAVMKYRPEPFYGRAVYFERGENPPLAGDPTYGWGPVMKSEFAVHKIPGKHGEMFQSPNVEIVAALIAERLA
jgi:thioesterase domain-containing protein